MSRTNRVAAFVLFAIVTVELGGWSLLGLLTSAERLNPFQEQFFRAGHGHAGVLLILALVYLLLLERAHLGQSPRNWLTVTLLLGIALQSGGFFLHLAIGEEGVPSAGTWVTRGGAVLLAVALIGLGVSLLRTSEAARGKGSERAAD